MYLAEESMEIIMKVDDIPEIADLSISEKILLVEDLWDNISVNDSDIIIPQSHIDELEKRNRRYQANPGNLLTLEQLQNSIKRRK